MSTDLPSVSIIVPVYNSEKYLVQCLESACGQTLSNIEIICVDDGSSDRSAEILTEFAEKDCRIRLFRQNNSGPGCARNLGIDQARGEYLAFLDSDDFWEPELLASSFRQAKTDNADICLYPFRIFNAVNGSCENSPYDAWLPAERPFRPNDHAARLFQMTPPGPVFRLYRSAFIKNRKLLFLPQYLAEDMYFVFLSMAFAEKITYIQNVYAYIRRGIEENISSSLQKYPLDTHRSLLSIKKELELAGVYKTYRKTFRTASISSSEYIFWQVPPEVLPMDKRMEMLAELDLADKPYLAQYHSKDEPYSGKLATLRRMIKTYGLDYTARYFAQSLRKHVLHP